jgi:hypothetical protein
MKYKPKDFNLWKSEMTEIVSGMVLNYYIRANDQITGGSEALKVT